MNELLSEARAQVSGAALAALDAEVAQLRKVLALMKPHDMRACDLAPGFVHELGLDPQVRDCPVCRGPVIEVRAWHLFA